MTLPASQASGNGKKHQFKVVLPGLWEDFEKIEEDWNRQTAKAMKQAIADFPTPQNPDQAKALQDMEDELAELHTHYKEN